MNGSKLDLLLGKSVPSAIDRAIAAFDAVARRDYAESYRELCEGMAFALGRFLGIRQRHILTRNRTLRARFIALPFVVAALATLCLADVSGIFRDSGSLRMAQTEFPAEPIAVASVETDGGTSGRLATPLPSALPEIDPAAEPDGPKVANMKIGKGDTISAVLQRAGLAATEAYDIVQALSDHLDPRKLMPGQSVSVRFEPDENRSYDFSEVKVALDPVRAVVVRRADGGGYNSRLDEKKIERRQFASKAKIETSLYGSAAKAGIPAYVIAEAIRIYSWDIDFQRDIHEGDGIEVLYDVYTTEDGQLARYGNLQYASLTVGGRSIPVYRHESKDGDVDYYDQKGNSVRKALLKTPVDGARVSSGFGMRRHPVLGYSKMHKGMDFAAPTGTPVYAAGDGVISRASRYSSYGNYVRIRHNNSLQTAYAHLSRYGKGIASGKRVKQGDIIGYVGTTGRSTGPHLHYEVLVSGKQVNPAGIKVAQGKTLAGRELEEFKRSLARMNEQYAALSGSVKLAQRSANPIR